MDAKISFIGEGGSFELTSFGSVVNRKLVIPSYQRPYAWKEDNIEALFETIQNSISETDSTTSSSRSKIQAQHDDVFFGSVILSEKTSRTDSPIFSIIDGQQRITTLLLILRTIQEKFKEQKKELDKKEDTFYKESDQAFENKDRKQHERLQHELFSLRQSVDNCEKNIKKIDNILQTASIKRHKYYTEDKSLDDSDYINYITKGTKSQDRDFKKKQEKIVNKIEQLANDLLENVAAEHPYEKYEKITSHILKKTKFCLLTVSGKDSEECAIDIFNTLNSTGEPLTGFEVLKSKLLHQAKKSDHETEAQKIFEEIEALSKEKKQARKSFITHTNKLLLYLVIYRNDLEKIPGNFLRSFSEQNNYIEKLSKSKNIMTVADQIRSLNKFVFNNWHEKENLRTYNTLNLSPLAAHGFDFLKRISHDRPLAIIYKYSPDGLGNTFKKDHYSKIIELCVAFSILWRMAHDGGASGIDSAYLDVAKEIANNSSLKSGFDLQQVQQIFQRSLSKKILRSSAPLEKESWLRKVSDSRLGLKKITAFTLAYIGLHRKTFQAHKHKNFNLYIVPRSNAPKNDFAVLGDVILLPCAGGSKLTNDKQIINEIKKMQNSTLFNDVLWQDVLDSDFDSKERTNRLADTIWSRLGCDVLGF